MKNDKKMANFDDNSYQSFISKMLDFLQYQKDNTENKKEIKILNELIGILEKYIS